MTNRLLVNPGTPQAWEIQLKSGQNRLGRGEQNDFTVNNPSVSRSHCEIVVSSAGVHLKDLGSTNGTFVNRAPVHEALLQTGQHLHLGGVEMLFEAGGSPAPPAPPPVPAPGAVRITSAPRPAPSGLRSTKAPAEEPAPAVVESPPLLMFKDIAARKRIEMASANKATEPSAPIAVGPAFCKFHQKTPARFLCEHCQKYFCDLCVTTRNVGGVAGKYCQACGAACVPVQV
jgi:predicted component of type VI protein secretion system